MAISPLEMHGMYSRTQDFTTLKHNEDNKGMLSQNMIQNQTEKEQLHQAKVVVHTQETQGQKQRQDARDKGNGIYMGDGGKKRKKEDAKAQGSMQKKTDSHFDMLV